MNDSQSIPTDWIGPVDATLPMDAGDAVLVGRVWDPEAGGPSPVAVRSGTVFDLSTRFATMRDLTEHPDPAAAVADIPESPIADVAEILANTQHDRRDTSRPWFVAPIDLHVVKAAGVTFAASMLERVIEERVRGDMTAADRIRSRILDEVGVDLSRVRPGSPEAAALKEVLIEQDLWSQYLEVGIGPDAEIFTKAPQLACVGTGTEVGVLEASTWNNPEPEVVLVVASSGTVVGATLGNDVNLRDVEGRSALLLPKAKDNNASASVGPFIRLVDDRFGLDDVRSAAVRLDIAGPDGFRLEADSDMTQISRDPLDLVGQLIGDHHQYPDGAVLYLGTLFAPTEDRHEPGLGFTHQVGDIVRISTPRLGSLVNRIQLSERCDPWEFGIGSLMRNLSARKLL